MSVTNPPPIRLEPGPASKIDMTDRYETIFFLLFFGALTIAAIAMSIIAFAETSPAEMVPFWN